MPTTEHTINDALASVLGDTRRAWRETPIVRSENTGALKGNTKRPDILISEPNVSPVVIETEIEPAVTVEQDAVLRLGEVIRKTGRTILSSIAVRLPLRLRDRSGNALRIEICDAKDLQMALYTGSEPFAASRWPKMGWVRGGVADLQESLAGGPGELAVVGSIEELRAADELAKFSILAEWRNILKVNYWPIFDIARRILELIPTQESRPLIERLAQTAGRLVENRLMRSHDLTGAVFQKLIADRKFLAAFYTTPPSAALLVGLTLDPARLPGGGTWASAGDVSKLRVADFACGTGTLLSTAYQRIGQLHELAGGDAEALHPDMMADALVGCDVLPAAAHLTASMLSGAHPTIKYKQSCILTVSYGRQIDDGIALGSLDLLDPQRKFDIVAVTAKSADAMGPGEKEVWSSLPHASFDMVIMNPPFTRATGQEGRKLGVPNPMFAAFSSTEEEQRLMGKATSQLTKGTSAHGNAGEASIFLVLADRKLKPDGTLALVMPLSLLCGDAWEKSRRLLAKNFDDLILVSIAAADDAALSFSADTGMGECLVVGRKVDKGTKRATFVILKERPKFPMVGASASTQIRQLIGGEGVRRLEDGPVGGTPIHFGDDIVGYVLSAPLPADGSGWNLSRIADLSLAQAAYQLAEHARVWLPGMQESSGCALPISTIANVGTIGPYHADINWTNANGTIRGPFEILPVAPGAAPTYPVLWTNDAPTQRTLRFEADSEGQIKQGRTEQERDLITRKAAHIWASASHAHFNRDFRFNSQGTGMQYTSRRTIGGRAWLSIRLKSEDQEKALVAWANTSLGLLVHWWHANKQQSGRGSIGKLALEGLPVYDVTSLAPAKLKIASTVFDELCDKPLLPFHEIDRDPIRGQLDERFGREVLDLPPELLRADGPLALLRMKLAREPSIRGSK